MPCHRQWSQLKKQLKARIAQSVTGRIDFHQTRYRHSHDQEGEFWITIDGDRIFSAGSMSYLTTLWNVTAENCDAGATIAEAYEQAWPVMEAQGLMLLEQINKALFCSLSQTVEQMIEQGNPVVRALAIVDARYGKRRLAEFDATAEHPLVQRFFQLRLEAEGMMSRS